MNRCIIAAAVALCATAGMAQANPSLSYSWDDCTGPIQKSSTRPGTDSLYVSATGMETHKAYEAWFSLASAQGDVPDAWRFDGEGCQGPAAIRFCPPSPLDTPALTASCPPAWGKGKFLTINGVRKASTVDDAGVPPNGLVFFLANAYNDVTDSDPNPRYAYARFGDKEPAAGEVPAALTTWGQIKAQFRR